MCGDLNAQTGQKLDYCERIYSCHGLLNNVLIKCTQINSSEPFYFIVCFLVFFTLSHAYYNTSTVRIRPTEYQAFVGLYHNLK